MSMFWERLNIKIARFRVFDRNTRHLIHLFEEDRHNDTLHLIHYLAIEKSLRSHWVYLVRSTPQMKLMIDQWILVWHPFQTNHNTSVPCLRNGAGSLLSLHEQRMNPRVSHIDLQILDTPHLWPPKRMASWLLFAITTFPGNASARASA